MRMRSCRETTMPATIPNATGESTNQSQWMRWLSTGFTHSENAVNQPGPKERRDEASQQNRPPRKHRQHGAVEQPDQQRCDQVNDSGNDKKLPMKCGDLPWCRPLRKKPAASRLIGYQMLAGS